MVLGHTFTTDKIFKVGDKIKILVEEIWKHKGEKGIHYSINKPRIVSKTKEDMTLMENIEDDICGL